MDLGFSLVAGLAAIALLVVFYVVAIYATGSRRAKSDVAMRYNVPDSLCPAALRYVYTLGSYEVGDIASSLVDMAVKGYIHIEEQGGLFAIVRGDADRSVLSPDEVIIADTLLGSDTRLSIFRHSLQDEMLKVLRQVHAWLSTTYKRVYFPHNYLLRLPGILIGIATTVLVLYRYAQAGRDTGFGACVYLAFASVACLMLYILMHVLRAARRRPGTGSSTRSIGCTVTFVVALLVGFLCATVGIVFLEPSLRGPQAVYLLQVIAVWVLYYHLSRRVYVLSPAGRTILREIEGFRSYIAGKHSLVALDRRHFEAHLPYAMALQVVDEWAAKYERGAGTGYVPDWYSGADVSNLRELAWMLSSSLPSAIVGSYMSDTPD